MKKFLLVISAICILSLSTYSQETPFVSGEIIVQLTDDVQSRDIAKQLSTFQGVSTKIKVDRQLSKIASIYLFTYDDSSIPENKVLSHFLSNPAVQIAQFNHIVEDRALPNDPEIGTQWHHVDGSDNDIDSDLAWDITTGGQTTNGDDIVVCVIEGGGTNYNHNDLIANHWTNPGEIDGNGVDDDGNGYIDDFNGWDPVSNTDNIGAGGHGTAVSGMIGAKGNNGIGGAGVNWDVKIMQVEVGGLTEANVIEAYDYPLTMRQLYNNTNGAQGAFVVATNASWGIDNANPVNYPVWCAYYDTIGAEGILNCGATANNNVNVDTNGDMPTGCTSPYMIGVTATNSSDQRTFSGYGINSIDLGAPGESVYLPSGSSGYSSTSGTSFASPCVAGAIALLYSAPCSDIATQALTAPQNTADLVRNYIFNGVDPIASLATEVATGGRLNVRNSIDLLINGCGPLPDCNAVSLGLSTLCEYDGNAVTASITLTPVMSENFCSVQTISYTSGGTPTVIDISSNGINNGDTYTIGGLASNTSYDIFFTTTEGVSSTESITTGDCVSEIPGCTDPGANNYDNTATFDDGSCIFPCNLVTFSVTVDCWGEEVGWSLTDDSDGSVVASLATGTYPSTDFETYTWSDCLEAGCYTMTITDSFGDGLSGASYGSCGTDGNYSMTNDSDGSILFSMGASNYGASITHNFCISTDGGGCTDPTACNYNPTATFDDGSCTVDDECGVCGGTGTAGCTDATACNFDPTAACDDGSCDASGCMDASACNYNAAAVCSGEACIYGPSNDLCANALPLSEGANTIDNSGACQTEGYSVPADGCNVTTGWCNQNGIEVDVFYSFATPSGPAEISLETSFDGTGTLIDTQMAIFSDCGGTLIAANDDGAADLYMSRLDFACGELLPNTTYLVLIDGYAGNQGTATLTLTTDFTNCGVPGCMDPTACNYDASATVDDGSCQTLDCNGDCGGSAVLDNCGVCNGDDSSCSGCTDNAACNYDATATINDGTCEYTSCSGCMDPAADNYDPSATIDDGSCTYPCDNDVEAPVLSETPADITLNCGDDEPSAPTVSAIDNCDASITVNYSEITIPGSGDGYFLERTWSATDASGNSTTYVQTIEFLDNCNPCPADINNNGIVEIADLTMLLGNYDCSSNCVADLDGDNAVTVNDLAVFLQAFGSTCP